MGPRFSRQGRVFRRGTPVFPAGARPFFPAGGARFSPPGLYKGGVCGYNASAGVSWRRRNIDRV